MEQNNNTNTAVKQSDHVLSAIINLKVIMIVMGVLLVLIASSYLFQ